MRPLPLSTLAGFCAAQLRGEGNTVITGVSSDSRAVGPGALFVALPGERVDGHDFVAAAAQRGAAAALVARPLPIDLPQLVVDDPLQALGRIAAGVHAGRDSCVLALTGSNGKTSVKSLLHAMLALHAPTYCNPGNHNNELGLPLAVLAQPEDVPYAIYEMGAGQPGDIAYLAEIARPQVALVNNIGPAHLERMGSLLGIAQTKGAIYQALAVGGCAVINADDAFATWFEAKLNPGIKVLRFAIDASAEVTARDLQLDQDGARFTLCTPQGERAVQLALVGRHNVSNALAAASMALAVGVPLDRIAEALAAVQPVAGRLQRFTLAEGCVLIDDSYNANPGSVRAAIATLAALPAPRWLVLGDMRELGPEADVLHAEIGSEARRAGLDQLLCVGSHARHAALAFGGRHFDSQAELIAILRSELRPGLTLLVKGSRGSRMDQVVSALRGAGEDAHAA